MFIQKPKKKFRFRRKPDTEKSNRTVLTHEINYNENYTTKTPHQKIYRQRKTTVNTVISPKPVVFITQSMEEEIEMETLLKEMEKYRNRDMSVEDTDQEGSDIVMNSKEDSEKEMSFEVIN